MCIKIDLHKAFDKINRQFIIHMMNQLGFCNEFCALISECINHVSFSILVNGTPNGFIHSNRGIRQGVPLSPYLFTIAMEYFTILMETELMKGNIKPINRTKPCITHLLYADDLLIFLNADTQSAKSVAKIFTRLEKHVGLKVNDFKSKIYFSKGCANKLDILSILKFKESNLPVKYLGLPLSANQVDDQDCTRLLDIIQARFEGWASKLLSFAGRIELTHTVITAIIMYWIQAHNIPAKAIHKIEKICANFIWNGKHHKIAWDKICKSKKAGGLGIRNINDLREVCNLKLFWRFINGNSLWAKWMKAKYLKNKNFWTTGIENHHSFVWKNILKSRDTGIKLLERKFKNGDQTDLWFDPWIFGKSLISLVGWTNLYSFGEVSGKVNVIIQNGRWNATAHPATSIFRYAIQNISIDTNLQNDKWEWKLSSKGNFSFKKTLEFIKGFET